MNNDFCTKHNLSFCKSELRNSQKRLVSTTTKGQVTPCGKCCSRGGSWLKSLPSLGLSFPTCGVGLGRPGLEPVVAELHAQERGWGWCENPIPGPSAGLGRQGVWLSFKELSRRGWGRGLRAIHTAGERSSRPCPPAGPLCGGMWPVVSATPLAGGDGGGAPGRLCPLVA